MIGNLFNTFIHDPLYNGLVFLIDYIPGADIGIAIILLTIIVRLVLFPIAQKAIKNQVKMRRVEPELAALRKKYKKDKPKLAQETMALYKQHGIKFTANLKLLLIQLPVILGLYFVFAQSGLPEIKPDTLYPFVPEPDRIKIEFLGLINLIEPSILLAALAGITQHLFTRFSFPPSIAEQENSGELSLQDEMQKRMRFMFMYPMPIMIAVFAYIFSGAVALYWVTSNIFSIGQELLVKRRFEKEEARQQHAGNGEHS